VAEGIQGAEERGSVLQVEAGGAGEDGIPVRLLCALGSGSGCFLGAGEDAECMVLIC